MDIKNKINYLVNTSIVVLIIAIIISIYIVIFLLKNKYIKHWMREYLISISISFIGIGISSAINLGYNKYILYPNFK